MTVESDWHDCTVFNSQYEQQHDLRSGCWRHRPRFDLFPQYRERLLTVDRPWRDGQAPDVQARREPTTEVFDP